MKHPVDNLGKYGKEGGPGRPKGSVGGRRQALQLLDKLLAEGIDRLEADWRKLFEKNPAAFWQKVAKEFVPKEFLLTHGGEMKQRLEIILSGGNGKANDDSDDSSPAD